MAQLCKNGICNEFTIKIYIFIFCVCTLIHLPEGVAGKKGDVVGRFPSKALKV